jgi:hypothetical protein
MFLSNFRKIKCNFLSKFSYKKNLFQLSNYNTSLSLSISNKSFATYRKQSPPKEIDFGIINEILDLCQLEPKMQPDYIRVKYCPLCEKPHHEESTNLYTLIVYKQSHVYYCFRCGNKGSFVRLFKVLNKLGDLSKYKDLFMKKPAGYSSNGGNTTDNDDYQSQSQGEVKSSFLVEETSEKNQNVSQNFSQNQNQNFHKIFHKIKIKIFHKIFHKIFRKIFQKKIKIYHNHNQPTQISKFLSITPDSSTSSTVVIY